MITIFYNKQKDKLSISYNIERKTPNLKKSTWCLSFLLFLLAKPCKNTNTISYCHQFIL